MTLPDLLRALLSRFGLSPRPDLPSDEERAQNALYSNSKGPR